MENLTLEAPAHESPKPTRRPTLSKDGKWRLFPKVPNLLQYISTGKYFARVKVDGKIIRQSLETDVFSTARLRLPDFLKKHRSKKRVDGAPQTFGDAQRLYEHDLEADYVMSSLTVIYRRRCIKKLNRTWPDLGNKKISRISETDCKQWASRLANELAAQYFNNVLGTFRLILKRGGITGGEDPTREVKRLGIRPAQPDLPELSQFLKMLEFIETSGAAQAKHCADLVRFLAFSGCRISEAKEVQWADVDLSKGTIKIRSAKRRRTGADHLHRLVPIIPEMRALLERLGKMPRSPEDRVCSVAECGKSLARASKLVGLRKKLTHHSLRHFFTTRCIESGVAIPTVAHWLGHKDGGALLMRVYGHLRQEHSIQMAQKVTFSSGANQGPSAPEEPAKN